MAHQAAYLVQKAEYMVSVNKAGNRVCRWPGRSFEEPLCEFGKRNFVHRLYLTQIPFPEYHTAKENKERARNEGIAEAHLQVQSATLYVDRNTPRTA